MGTGSRGPGDRTREAGPPSPKPAAASPPGGPRTRASAKTTGSPVRRERCKPSTAGLKCCKPTASRYREPPLAFRFPEHRARTGTMLLLASNAALPPRLNEAVSIDLTAGGKLLVTGPNGAGKATLLRILARHLPPSRGTLHRSRSTRVSLVGQETTCRSPGYRTADLRRACQPSARRRHHHGTAFPAVEGQRPSRCRSLEHSCSRRVARPTATVGTGRPPGRTPARPAARETDLPSGNAARRGVDGCVSGTGIAGRWPLVGRPGLFCLDHRVKTAKTGTMTGTSIETASRNSLDPGRIPLVLASTTRLAAICTAPAAAPNDAMVSPISTSSKSSSLLRSAIDGLLSLHPDSQSLSAEAPYLRSSQLRN